MDLIYLCDVYRGSIQNNSFRLLFLKFLLNYLQFKVWVSVRVRFLHIFWDFCQERNLLHILDITSNGANVYTRKYIWHLHLSQVVLDGKTLFNYCTVTLTRARWINILDIPPTFACSSLPTTYQITSNVHLWTFITTHIVYNIDMF